MTVFGGFFGGSRIRTEPTMRLRLGDRFTTALGLSRNDVDLPSHSFQTNLARARVSYSFSPRVFVQTLVQYNDVDGLWSANLRVAWLQNANTGLFVVYNDTRGLDSRGELFSEIPDDRSLVIKFSKQFDLLN